MSAFYSQGQVDQGTLVEAYAIVAGFILFFFCIFGLRGGTLRPGPCDGQK